LLFIIYQIPSLFNIFKHLTNLTYSITFVYVITSTFNPTSVYDNYKSNGDIDTYQLLHHLLKFWVIVIIFCIIFFFIIYYWIFLELLMVKRNRWQHVRVILNGWCIIKLNSTLLRRLLLLLITNVIGDVACQLTSVTILRITCGSFADGIKSLLAQFAHETSSWKEMEC